MENNQKTSVLDIKYILKIALPLIIITSLCALLLAVINGFTAERIAQNAERAKSDAIAQIFVGCDEGSPLLDIEAAAPVKEVYEVYSGGSLIGYCVSVGPKGFDGEIDMMVGISVDQTVVGVRIIDHSETPGLGANTADEQYLAQYIGKSGNLTLNSDVDAIAGATKSSRAVLSGVNAALSLNIFDAQNTTDTIVSDNNNTEGGDGE